MTSGSWRRRLLSAITALLLVAVVAAVRVAADRDPLSEARRRVADDAAFASAIQAGVTFTKVSSALEDAADDCQERGDHLANRCAALFAGAGYARVSAAGVLRCTRPGVFQARVALRRYLAELDDDRRAPAFPPPVVSCA